MHLEGHWKRYSEATDFLRGLAHEMVFDLSKSLTAQDPKVVELFVAEARKSYPYFNKYQDAWPVRAFLGIFLKKQSYRIRHARGPKSQSGNSAPREQNEDHISASGYLPVSKTKPKFKPWIPAPANGCPEAPAAKKNNDASCLVPPLTRAQSKRSQPTAAPAVTTPITITKAEGSQSLHSFLRTVEPLLATVVSSFYSVGIYDEEAFRVVADWPEDERDALLLQDVKLTPFHFRLSRILMARLRPVVLIDL